jgi:hypothetical protein
VDFAIISPFIFHPPFFLILTEVYIMHLSF